MGRTEVYHPSQTPKLTMCQDMLWLKISPNLFLNIFWNPCNRSGFLGNMRGLTAMAAISLTKISSKLHVYHFTTVFLDLRATMWSCCLGFLKWSWWKKKQLSYNSSIYLTPVNRPELLFSFKSKYSSFKEYSLNR